MDMFHGPEAEPKASEPLEHIQAMGTVSAGVSALQATAPDLMKEGIICLLQNLSRNFRRQILYISSLPTDIL